MTQQEYSPALADSASNTLQIKVGNTISTIRIASGGLAQLGTLIRARYPALQRVFVVTVGPVWAAHGAALVASLQAADLQLCLQTIPDGEPSKSLAQATILYEWLAAERAERREPLIAFGGGVVGDLVGFVAATYLRGVPFIQVPLSLLAMVDSSVGGKTAVNLPAGKNLVGAFLQPELVVVDPALLATLSPREQRSGWAEVIKYAFFDGSVPQLTGPRLLPLLREEGPALRALAEPACSTVITQCLRIKAAVVEQDERETGLRRVLNLGHTIGHAIEAVAGYGRYTHGEAVALGTRAVARVAVRYGCSSEDLVQLVDELFDAFGLPAAINGCSVAALIARFGSDKKVQAGRVHWILPTVPGEVIIRDDVALADVQVVLAALGATAP